MPHPDDFTRDVLRLTLIPGLGPVLIARLLAALGTPDRVLAAAPASLRAIQGIGPERAAAIAKAAPTTAERAASEIALAATLGVSLIARGSAAYPPLLDQLPDAPPLLYCRGTLDASRDDSPDRHTVAIVGSRRCTAYGIEQAERFAAYLASAGLTVVSGGARGIDTAAHRAAIRLGGRTLAVLGCGLAHTYPEENAELFARIAGFGAAGTQGSTGVASGAILSELPLQTPPSSENFPARNRIISGLSLGVVVIEAGLGSGALITARLAADDHGREVFALPDRVNAPASQGSNQLLKESAAAMVTDPADVLTQLESQARNLHLARVASNAAAANALQASGDGGSSLFSGEARPADKSVSATNTSSARAGSATPTLKLTEAQAQIVAALASPLTLDELARATDRDPGSLRADLTVLELRRAVRRAGPRFERVDGAGG